MISKLSELKPGMADWSVVGFVKQRGELKSYKSNEKSKWFDFKLTDDELTIRVICFEDTSSKFDKVIKTECYYKITDGKIQESTFKGNTSTEIILTQNSEVIPQTENDVRFEIPKFQPFDLISSITNARKCKINIIGFVKCVNEDEKAIIDGKSMTIKKIIMYDEGAQVNVTLWNREEDLKKDDLIAVEDGIIKTNNNGKSINVGTTSSITTNPECKEAERLKKWKSTQNENPSQKIDVSHCSQESKEDKFSKQELLDSATRELEELEKKQEELNVKRVRLNEEIRRHK